MKRITSVILAIALIFALAVTAMAAEIAPAAGTAALAADCTHPHFREPGLYQFRHCSGL